MTIIDTFNESYRQAQYWVFTDAVQPDMGHCSSICLTVGEGNKQVEPLLTELGASQAALITANNPVSERLTAQQNRTLQLELLDYLKNKQYQWIDGCNKDPQGEWPDEPSCLILGIDKKQAQIIAKQFRQAAFVFLDHHNVWLEWTE